MSFRLGVRLGYYSRGSPHSLLGYKQTVRHSARRNRSLLVSKRRQENAQEMGDQDRTQRPRHSRAKVNTIMIIVQFSPYNLRSNSSSYTCRSSTVEAIVFLITKLQILTIDYK